MKRIFFIPLILLMFGCETLKALNKNPFSDGIPETKVFPLSEMKEGRTIEEIKRTIHHNDPVVKSFQSPHDHNENMTALEYELIPADCNCKDYASHWLVFYQEKLISWGMGSVKDAEFLINKSYIEALLDNKKIKPVEAETWLYKVSKRLYGSDPNLDEIFTFKIFLAEKIEKGEISFAEAGYLLSKKKNELIGKERELAIQQNQIQMQKQAIKQAMFFQFWNSTRQNNVNCITQYIGNSAYTNCR